MKTIQITKRSDDFHAHIEGDRGVWGCGKTIDEAVGDLIQSNAALFEIRFWHPARGDE